MLPRAKYEEIRAHCKEFALAHIEKGWSLARIRTHLAKEYEGLVSKQKIVQWIDNTMQTYAYTDEKLQKRKPRNRAYAIAILHGIINASMTKGDFKTALAAVKDLTLLTGVHPSTDKEPTNKTTVNILNQGMQTQRIESMTDDELRRIAMQSEIPAVLESTDIDVVVEDLNGS